MSKTPTGVTIVNTDSGPSISPGDQMLNLLIEALSLTEPRREIPLKFSCIGVIFHS
jgi:hypothetical protein